jgi:ABC-type branched-subunit amino acid transport system ATPase component/predicted MFS family arabinose efflux permease
LHAPPDSAGRQRGEMGEAMGGTTEGSAPSAASLTAAVLDEEARRQSEQAASNARVVLDDAQLPGVGEQHLTLREGLRTRGARVFGVLLVIVALDELSSAALGVLAPDIRDSFGISNGAIVFISAAAGSFIVLGALPMGWLADRCRRAPVIGWATLVFSAMVFLSGLAVNAFMLFWTQFGAGIAKSSNLTVHGSMLADTYPISIRGRVSATRDSASRLVGVLSPVLVGGIAAVAGGVDGWRWAFLLLGVPVAVFAIFAFTLPEPPRGQFEKTDVLGEVIEEANPAPISTEAAFARLLQIRTLKLAIVAFAAMGFGLFTTPILANLFLEDEYGLGSFDRGVVGTCMGVGVLVALPFVGRYYDRLYQESPARALKLVGVLVLPAAVFVPIQFSMPNPYLFVVFGIPQVILLSAAFTMVAPVLQAVVPYRLRGMGAALGSIYIFFVGATGGALLAAVLTDAVGIRATILVLSIPSTVIGGLMIVRSSTFIRDDLSMVVEELHEEMEEHLRQQAAPETIPALQVRNIDFAYGNVQVLFDVSFDVRRGEVLALLGTNGAGKSTILRVIAGLGTPSRGVVRLGGRTITYVTPEQRAGLGIHMLPGGKGVFPQMSVRENLQMGAFGYRKDAADMRARIDRVLELFPRLSARAGQAAGSLSGGEQQMLALARTLLNDPEVLIIDELSLGLAPLVVEELLRTIEDLKASGMTIVIVEQSLNVALSIADRAVFMEKGHVRFVGSAQDLAARDDLARAVFLGREGG